MMFNGNGIFMFIFQLKYMYESKTDTVYIKNRHKKIKMQISVFYKILKQVVLLIKFHYYQMLI